ncbi:hypothetical protein EPO05_04065 [Patescibacteria group bacterium]|nr:MAG: hypothetical protein EPO05_04065 [Patescibacteria group bacterium]
MKKMFLTLGVIIGLGMLVGPEIARAVTVENCQTSKVYDRRINTEVTKTVCGCAWTKIGETWCTGSSTCRSGNDCNPNTGVCKNYACGSTCGACGTNCINDYKISGYGYTCQAGGRIVCKGWSSSRGKLLSHF